MSAKDRIPKLTSAKAKLIVDTPVRHLEPPFYELLVSLQLIRSEEPYNRL